MSRPQNSLLHVLESLEIASERVTLLTNFLRKEAIGETEEISAVVVVDPIGIGLRLVQLLHSQGYALILVYSLKHIEVYAQSRLPQDVETIASITKDEQLDEGKALDKALKDIKAEIRKQGCGYSLAAVITGSEAGVLFTDKLSNRLGCMTNGEELSLARRNKALMQEKIAAAGIRAIRQKLAYSSAEVSEFFGSLRKGGKCVVKPNMSAANESVVLCSTLAEALQAFRQITGKLDLFGNSNDGVLCQEFLKGGEYVVDGVSRAGKYKVAAIWKYDKGEFNGGSFVYFGMKLVHSETHVAKRLVKYAEQVVRALRISYGPSHMELILDTSPCLIEVAPRCHNKKGTWLPIVKECIGYSQVEATMYSYLDEQKFEALPQSPVLRKEGAEVHLVSRKGGKITGLPGLDVITQLSSFASGHLPNRGDVIKPTRDALTRVGTIQLVAETAEDLAQDYRKIREMEDEGTLFLLEE